MRSANHTPISGKPPIPLRIQLRMMASKANPTDAPKAHPIPPINPRVKVLLSLSGGLSRSIKQKSPSLVWDSDVIGGFHPT